jgi:hypothetical protein
VRGVTQALVNRGILVFKALKAILESEKELPAILVFKVILAPTR